MAPQVVDSLNAEIKTAQTDFMVSSGAKDLYQDVSKLFETEQKANSGNKPGVPGTTQTSATGATAGCPDEIRQVFGDGSVLENLASKKGMSSDYVKLVRGFIGDVVIQSPATTGTTYQAQYISPCDRNNSFDTFISGTAQGRDTAGACADITDAKKLLNLFGRAVQLQEMAHTILSSQKGNKAGASPESCQLALLGEGMQHIRTLEEKTLQLLSVAQQSYANTAAEINSVEMIVQNMKKFDDTVFSELADRFGKGIAMRATGRI